MTREKIEISFSADGWCIYVGNKVYHWDHNEEDLGTTAIYTLLSDLGYKVAIVEEY